MEVLIEKLSLLRYETEFCLQNKLRPLSRAFFLVPLKNRGEQFFYLVSLSTWLLRKCGQVFDMPGQFEDPNIAISNIQMFVTEQGIQAIGIEFDDGISRLRQAYGEPVVSLLNRLVDFALQSARISLAPQPISFDMDEALENTWIEDKDLLIPVEDGDDYDDYDDEPNSHKPMINLNSKAKANSRAGMSDSNLQSVDLNQWKLEVERVAPLLRVALPSDNKDWRVHLQQLDEYRKIIKEETKNILPKMQSVRTTITSSLEKISSREKYMNSQFEDLCAEYRSLFDVQSQSRASLSTVSDRVNSLNNELAQVTENLEIAQSQMDDLGNGISDPKPLVQIKQARQRLQDEIKEMKMKIALLRHDVFHKKLSSKTQPELVRKIR